MPVNDPESILSYQVKCIYVSEAVPVTFNLCALQPPSNLSLTALSAAVIV